MPWFQRICRIVTPCELARVRLGEPDGQPTYHHARIALAEVHGRRVEVGPLPEGVEDGVDEDGRRREAVRLQPAELHRDASGCATPTTDLLPLDPELGRGVGCAADTAGRQHVTSTDGSGGTGLGVDCAGEL